MEAHPRESPESDPQTDLAAVTADANQLEIPSIVVQTGLSPPNSPRNKSPPDSCSTRENCRPPDSAAVELAGSDDRRGFRVQQQDRDHHQKSTGGLGRLVSSSSFNGSNRSPSPKVQRSKSFKHQRTLAKQRGVSEDAEWTWDPLPDCNEDPQTSNTAGGNYDDDKSFPTAAGRIERPRNNTKMRNGVTCGGGRGRGRTSPPPSSGATMTRTRSLDYPNFCLECRSSSPASAAGRGGSSTAAAGLDCGSPGCRNYCGTIRTNSSSIAGRAANNAASRNSGASTTYSGAAAEGSSRRNGRLLRHSESALADEPLPSENKGGASGGSFVGQNEEPDDELDPTAGRQHRQLHSPLLSARIRHPEQQQERQRESSPSPSNRLTSSRSFPSPSSTSTSARAAVGPGGASRWAEPAEGPPSAAQQSSSRTTNVAGGSKTLKQRNSKVRLLVRSEAMREATSPPPEVNFPPLPLPALAYSPAIGGGANVCGSSPSSAPAAPKQQHRQSVSPCSPALDDGNKPQQQLSSSSMSTSPGAPATTGNGTSNPGSNNKPPPSLGGCTSIRRYKFRQQGSSQSAGSMTSVDESPPPLSRDDSVEQYKDFAGMSSGELENFIVETLHRSPKDRMTLLKIESDLVSFAKDETRTSFKFPAMSSYQRMLVHRVAAYFGMAHNVDAAGTCVVVERTRSTRTPGMKFRDQIRPDVAWTCPFPQQQQHHLSETRRSILKKDSSSFEEYKSSSSGELLDSPLRYWGSSSAESTGGTAGGAGPGAISKSHPWSSSTESSDGIMAPPLLHSSSARGSRPPRAQKVQSFDSESLLALPERRPGMAKANSFGGYSGSTGTGDPPYSTSPSATAGINSQHGGGRGHILMRGPFSRGDSVSSTHSASARLVSKQDSVSSSTASYLSAGSSGYKSCRGSSFETRTPSPGVGGCYYLSVNAQTQTHSLQSSQGPSPDIPDSVQVESGGPSVDIISSCSIDHDNRRHTPNRHVGGEHDEEEDDDDEYEPEVARAMGLPCPASPGRADGESGRSPSSTIAVMDATAITSGSRNQQQESSMTSTALLWALSSMEDVPSGAILINPQTGKPLINPDGSIYRFNRSNPPQIVAPNPSASGVAYCRVRQHHHQQGSSLQQLPPISHVMSATGIVRPHVADAAANLASYVAHHHQLLGPADGAHQHVQSAQGPHHGAFHDMSSSSGPLQVRPVSPSTSAGSLYTVASCNGHQLPALRHLGWCTTTPSQQQHHFGLPTAAQQFSDEVTSDSFGDLGSPAMAASVTAAGEVIAHTHQLPRYLSHHHHYSPPEAAAAAGIGNLYPALALGMGGAGDAASSPSDEYAAHAAPSSSSGTTIMGGQQQGPYAADEGSWGENDESPSSGLGALSTPAAAAAVTATGSSAVCGGSNGTGSIPYNNYECLGMDESYRNGAERAGTGLAQQGIAAVPAGSATTSPYASVVEVPTMYGASAGAIYAPANAGLIVGKPANDNSSVSAAVFPSSSFFPSQHHPSAPVSKTPMSVSSALAGSRQTNDNRGPAELPGWMAAAVREHVEDLATRACQQTPPATALVTSGHLELTHQQQQHLVHSSIAAQHSSLNPAASAFVAAGGHHQQQFHPNSAYFQHHHQFQLSHHRPHPADILTSQVNSAGPGLLVPSYPSNTGQQHIHHQQALQAMAGAQHQHQHQHQLGVTQSNVNPQLTAAVAVVSPTPAVSGLPHAGAAGQFQQVSAAGSGLHHAAVLLGSAGQHNFGLHAGRLQAAVLHGPAVPQCVGGLHGAYRLPHLAGPGHPAVEATMLHSSGAAAGYVHQQLLQHQQAHHHGFLPTTAFSHPFLQLRGSHQQQYTGQLHHQHQHTVNQHQNQHHHHHHQQQQQQAQLRGPRFGGGGSSSAMSPRIPRGSSFHHGVLGSGGSHSVTIGAREHFANRSASFTATDTSRRCENPRPSDDGVRRRRPDHAGQGDEDAAVVGGAAGHELPAHASPESTQSPSTSIHAAAVPHRPLSSLQQQPRSEGSDMDLIANEKPSHNPPVTTGAAEGDRHD